MLYNSLKCYLLDCLINISLFRLIVCSKNVSRQHGSTGCGKNSYQMFWPFSRQSLGVLSKHFADLYTIMFDKCQVVFDSIEKQRNYGLFNVTTYRFSSVKMFVKLSHCDSIMSF